MILDQDKTYIHIKRTNHQKIIFTISFNYRKIDNKPVLIDSQRWYAKRYNCVHEIRKYRSENRPLIILDGTWFDIIDIFRKGGDDSSRNWQT